MTQKVHKRDKKMTKKVLYLTADCADYYGLQAAEKLSLTASAGVGKA